MSNFFDDNDDVFGGDRSKKKSDDFDFSDNDEKDPFDFGDPEPQRGKPASDKTSWLESLPKLPKWGWISAGTAATLVVGGISLGPLGGYSEIRKATSEAYRLGFERSVEEFGSIFSYSLPSIEFMESWGIEGTKDFSYDSPEMLDAITDYCAAVWGMDGRINGLINSESNKSDYVDGCEDGYISLIP